MNATEVYRLKLLRAVANNADPRAAHNLPENYVKFQKNGVPMLTPAGRDAFRELGYRSISANVSKHMRKD